MSDILDRDAIDLAADLEAGNLSAEEVMRATLDRIGEVNGRVNAIVSLREPDALLTEAQQADESKRKGWMHGLPLAVKDLANAKGLRTTMGSPVFADQVAQSDDIMVARMRAAGAIIIGKTNTPEFGLGSNTFNPVHGATCNPYDLTRSAGGSSGGAAAALACRMLPVADGSDMMGSLRNPAAWNNVYGFRPSWGRVPSEPVGDSFLHQLATNGPMARSPRDVAALLDIQSGPDPRQPHGCPVEPTLPGIETDVKGRRIGWLRDWGGAYGFEPGILELSEKALGHFDDIGCIVEEVPAPFAAEAIWESWTTLRSWSVAAGTAALYENDETRSRLKPEAIWEIERGLAFSAMDVHRASVIRSEWFKVAAGLFDRYDALILPSTQVWPFPIEWRYPERVNDTDMDTYHRWMEVVVPPGLLGLPCLNMPAGFNADGLPLGLQMFGRRGADASLLQIGHAWHAATPHFRAKPSVLTAP
ncbi:amidase [Aquicoccus porphyridii]|uniref:Amidase n=1 Tax=Aquicoccus porphyridii TaxID=1852029 RepID=A0A5A9ZSE1_9RHOB|nr:amidase [Aquicoccus porphyridii]KAA0920147.1 amidase [Aquicoccus porphyridii]RAI55054.1 amidase [Rhodobacteraceae bacterium AsT-22]